VKRYRLSRSPTSGPSRGLTTPALNHGAHLIAIPPPAFALIISATTLAFAWLRNVAVQSNPAPALPAVNLNPFA
jgi:hypothetical protein